MPAYDYDAVLAAVAEEFGMPVEAIFKNGQQKSSVTDTCIYLLRHVGDMSISELAAGLSVSKNGIQKVLIRHSKAIEGHRHTQNLIRKL
jgi:hypothetical protein